MDSVWDTPFTDNYLIYQAGALWNPNDSFTQASFYAEEKCGTNGGNPVIEVDATYSCDQ